MVDVDRFRGCLLGLAVGDALGAPVEALPRGAFSPVLDMIPAPDRGLRAGQWTDDTATALCLAVSLIEKGGFDAYDFLNRLLRWWNEGYMDCTGTCYGIGPTTRRALTHFRKTGTFGPQSGFVPKKPSNGCIMRLAPVAMFYCANIELAEQYAAEAAQTTHPLPECVDAARLFARILYRALQGLDRETVLLADRGRFQGHPAVVAIADGGYFQKQEEEIRASLAVTECLEAALWCFAKADSFRDAVLRAVNLGGDTDTAGAICGQLAGAFWGSRAIPTEWLEKLAWRERIQAIADELYRRASALDSPTAGTDNSPDTSV